MYNSKLYKFENCFTKTLVQKLVKRKNLFMLLRRRHPNPRQVGVEVALLAPPEQDHDRRVEDDLIDVVGENGYARVDAENRKLKGKKTMQTRRSCGVGAPPHTNM